CYLDCRTTLGWNFPDLLRACAVGDEIDTVAIMRPGRHLVVVRLRREAAWRSPIRADSENVGVTLKPRIEGDEFTIGRPSAPTRVGGFHRRQLCWVRPICSRYVDF